MQRPSSNKHRPSASQNKKMESSGPMKDAQDPELGWEEASNPRKGLLSKASFQMRIFAGIGVWSILLICLVWGGWYGFSRMRTSIDSLSQPDDYLLRSKELFSSLTYADYNQESFMLTRDSLHYWEYSWEMDDMILKIDTLKALNPSGPQSERLDSMYPLLSEKRMVMDSLSNIGADERTEILIRRMMGAIEPVVVVAEGGDQENKSGSGSGNEEGKQTKDGEGEGKKKGIFGLWGKKTDEQKAEEKAEKERRKQERRDRKKKKQHEVVPDDGKYGPASKRNKPNEKGNGEEVDLASNDRETESRFPSASGSSDDRDRSSLDTRLLKKRQMARIEQNLEEIRDEEMGLIEEEIELELALKERSIRITDEIVALTANIEADALELAEEGAENAKTTARRIRRFILGITLTVITLFVFISIFIFRSIRKNRQYEEQLIEARKEAEDLGNMKEEFLANMSHEIRTPMNAILGLANLLEAAPLRPEEAQYASTIKSSSDILLSLINNILDYSRLEAGRVEAEKVGFYPEALISQVAEMMEFQMRSKNITLVREIAPGLREKVLIGDPARTSQIIINLMGNAVKFTPQNGKIFLRAGMEGDQFRFQVEDTGPGIPKESLQKIFEVFTQADASVAGQYGGTGLGLSICKQLTDLFGGTITAKSPKGKGAVFTVILPLPPGKKKDVPKRVEFSRTGLSQRLRNARVLVVDDEEFNRYYSGLLLEKWGLKFEMAEDGPQALKRVEKGDLDILLLDIRMPGMSGTEVAQIIRKHKNPRIRSLALVATTANVGHKERKQYLSQGMDRVVVKPFGEDELREAMEFALGAQVGELKTPDKREEKTEEKANPISKTTITKPSPKKSGSTSTSGLKIGGISNPEVLIRMLGIFEDTAGKTVTRLEEGLKVKDWKEIAEASHKIVPSLRHLGEQDLVEGFRGLEADCDKEENLGTVPDRVKELIKKLETVRERVTQERTRLDHSLQSE